MADVAQPVVDAAKDQAEPGTAATDARKVDDLDSLLAQFASETKPAVTTTKPETTTGTTVPPAPIERRLEAIEQERARDQVQRDLKPVIDKIKAGTPAGFFDDNEIEDWVASRAQRDPRLANAWMNRHQNPQAWGKVVDALSGQMSSKFAKLPDKGATEDRAAVTAAVRGASTKAPEGQAPNYGKMSDAEYAKDVEQKFGFRPL